MVDIVLELLISAIIGFSSKEKVFVSSAQNFRRSSMRVSLSVSFGREKEVIEVVDIVLLFLTFAFFLYFFFQAEPL